MSARAAITGIGCRLPGASNPDEFWALMRSQRHGLRNAPPGRYEAFELTQRYIESIEEIGHQWGGYIDGPELIDPVVFGISRVEASMADPQHRLLLEVVWEALENACEAPEQLAGTRTGVFVGLSSFDYALFLAAMDPYGSLITPLTIPGVAHCIAANRISRIFDLRGPSIATDTACSSSSYALHYALRSLEQGECDTAIVCGANMIMTPYLTKGFKRARMVSKDGLVKCFDEKTDGYVRAEGAVALILRREDDAIARGNRIMSVIASSAINHDGKTPGIASPSQDRQVELISAAHLAAGVEPSEISFVEAHGTGTYRGDETELNALNQIFSGTREQPCFVGSVKANVGHLEAVSGLAGVLKTVLCFENNEIPGQANFNKPMSAATVDGSRIVVPDGNRGWPHSDKARRAGVSCLGFGGSNSHIVLEEPPRATDQAPHIHRPTELLKFSAKTSDQVSQMAANLRDFLKHRPGLDLGDVCYSANIGRADFEDRAAIVARSREDLLAKLTALEENKISPKVLAGRAPRKTPKVALALTAISSQDVEIASCLYETEPRFAKHIDRCDDQSRALANFSVQEAITKPSSIDPPQIDETALGRVTVFSIQYALAAFLFDLGVRPSFIFGDGIGQSVAKALENRASLPDALQSVIDVTPESDRTDIEKQTRAAISEGADIVLSIGSQNNLDVSALAQDAGREIHNLAFDPDQTDADAAFATLIAKLYTSGVNIDWQAYGKDFQRHRLALPTYPFARERFWFTDGGKLPGTIVAQQEEETAKRQESHQTNTQLTPDTSQAPSPNQPIPLTMLKWHRVESTAPQLNGRGRTNGKLQESDDRKQGDIPDWYCIPLASHCAPFAEQLTATVGAQLALDLSDIGNERTRSTSRREKGLVLVASGKPNGVGDADDMPNGQWALCRALLRVTQKIARRTDIERVVVLTSNGQRALDSDLELHPEQGALWGFCRTLQWEYPKWSLSLIDLNADDLNSGLAKLPSLIRQTGGSRQIALRDNCVYEPRLSFYPQDIVEPTTDKSDRVAHTKHHKSSEHRKGQSGRDTYLVTGGLGALGLTAADWLARRGTQRIVLASRRAPSPDVSRKIQSLRQLGSSVDAIQLDVTNKEEIATCIDGIERGGDTLKGVVHAAGVLEDALLPSIDERKLDDVFEAKAGGAWTLHELTKDCDLEHFICFSSISAVLGSPGQAHYAAANAYLNTLCELRRANGLPAQSINWGPWSTGMAGSGATRRRFEQMGLRSIDDEPGIAALDQIVAHGEVCVFAADGDWSKVRAITQQRGPFKLLDDIVAKSDLTRVDQTDFAHSSQAISRKDLFDFMRASVSAATTVPANEISAETKFTDVALDSIAGLELILRIENKIGVMPEPDLFAEDMSFGAMVDVLYTLAQKHKKHTKPDAIKDNKPHTIEDAIRAPNGAAPLNGPSKPVGDDDAVDQTQQLLNEIKAELNAGDYLETVRPDFTMALHEMLLDVDFDYALGDRVRGTRFGTKVSAIDMLGGFGSTLFGHNHPALVAILRDALNTHRPKFVQMSNRTAAGTLAKTLSARVAKHTGRDYRIILGSSGAEMIDAAIKHALFEWSQRRQSHPSVGHSNGTGRHPVASSKPVIMAIEGSYHGKTLAAHSLTWSAPGRDTLGLSGPFEVVWLPRDDVDEAQRLFRQYQNEGSATVGAAPLSRIAAVFLEPIQGEGGIFPLAKPFAASLRQLCDEARCPIVVDEIQSGMGRAGAFTAASLIDLVGDYYLFGKSLGGGLTKTSALLVDSERYSEGFGFAHTSTFAEDDHSSLVALGALKLLEADNIEFRAHEAGTYLKHQLSNVMRAYPDVLSDVRGCGLMVGIELAAQANNASKLISGLSEQKLLGLFVASHLLHRCGVRVGTALSRPSTLRLEPSAYISQADMDHVVQAIKSVCEVVRAADAADFVRHLAQGFRMSGQTPFRFAARDAETTIDTRGTGHKAKNNRAVFLGHMIDADDIALLDPSLMGLSEDERENLAERLVDPVLVKRVPLQSSNGETLDFEIHTIPITSRAIVRALRAGQSARIVEQVNVAVERFANEGARVVGLGGLLSVITRNGLSVRNGFKDMQITTGNTYTVALAAEAVTRACAERKLDLSKTKIGVVGAGGNIGSTLVQILCEHFSQLRLVGRKESIARVERTADAVYQAALAALQMNDGHGATGLAATISETQVYKKFCDENQLKDKSQAGESGTSAGARLRQMVLAHYHEDPFVPVCSDVDSLSDCEIIVTASNAVRPILTPRNIGPVTKIICDVSVPSDVDPELIASRPDMTVIRGSVAEAPANNDFRFDMIELPENHMLACMTETALLGFSGKQDFSVVGDIEAQGVRKCHELGRKYGFRLGYLAVEKPFAIEFD